MTQHLQCAHQKLGDRVYVKYQIVVPKDVVEIAGWKPREPVTFQAGPLRTDGKRKIILTATAPEAGFKRMTYEQFRDAISAILRSNPKGLVYSQIRAANSNLPMKPHALWVHRMKLEAGLKRLKEPNGMTWIIPMEYDKA